MRGVAVIDDQQNASRPDLARHATTAAWWSTLEIASRYGVQFVVTLVLARLLTPADFGLIAMLLVFTSVGSLLVDSGFGTALIQRQLVTADDETTVFLFTTFAGLIVATILFVTAPLIAAFFAQPALTGLTRLMALVLPLGGLAAVPDALLTMQLDFRTRASAEMIASLVSGVLALLLAWLGFGVWSLAWQAVIAIALRALMLWINSGWRPRGHFSARSLVTLFRFGGFMFLSGLLDVIFVRLQSLLIGRLYDARSLGYYTLAQNTQNAPASFMGGVLNRVGLPVFATLAHDSDKLRRTLQVTLRIAMFLFVPVMVGIALVAGPLIEALYGAKWISAAPILSVLALGTALWPVHVLNLAAISAQGRSDLFFRLELAKKIVGIGLVIACSPWGPLAIAWAALFSSVAGALINTHYSKKLLSYGILEQARDQTETFTLALIAAAIGWSILHWTSAGTVTMLAALLASAITYLGIAMVFKHPSLVGLLELLRTLRSGSSTTRKA